MNYKIKAICAGTFLALSTAISAQAATVACDSTLSGLVTPNAGCEISDSNSQDFLNSNPLTVNADAFFGFTDWAFVAKDDTVGDGNADSGDTSAFSTSGNVSSGTWNLADTAFGDYMLIFKGGKSNLVGYLLSGTSGDFASPLFSTSKNGKVTNHDISHISLYARGTPPSNVNPPSTVPVPASMPLLVMGLGLVGWVARRRKT